MDKIFSDSFAHFGESFGLSSFPISSTPLTTSLAFVSLSVQTHLVETALSIVLYFSVHMIVFPAFKFFFLCIFKRDFIHDHEFHLNL